MRPVVNTEKHIIQNSFFTVASGALTSIVISQAVAAPTSREHVREGAKISAIYLEYWITTDDGVIGTTITTMEKRPAGAAVMTAAQSALLNDYLNKKNVFYTQMGLTPPNVMYPMSTIKGWFKVPKSKQRQGLGDKIVINFHGQSNGINVCGFALYKEQY